MTLLDAIAKYATIEMAFLLTAGLVGLWVLFGLLRRGADPADLVIGDDGKLSWTKTLACVGGTVFTYGFIHLVAAGTLTEWFFNGYGLICFGSAFAYKMNALKSGAMPQRTTRVDAPADAAVDVSIKSGGNP
jgi:hypothetical protein